MPCKAHLLPEGWLGIDHVAAEKPWGLLGGLQIGLAPESVSLDLVVQTGFSHASA